MTSLLFWDVTWRTLVFTVVSGHFSRPLLCFCHAPLCANVLNFCNKLNLFRNHCSANIKQCGIPVELVTSLLPISFLSFLISGSVTFDLEIYGLNTCT
jgi:hypothetical protein